MEDLPLLSEKDEKDYQYRLKNWYKIYPFIHPNLSYPFEKLRLLKLYFKLEEVWCKYPAFWIAYYILGDNCWVCKYWNYNSLFGEEIGFCKCYKKITYKDDWCSGFRRRT